MEDAETKRLIQLLDEGVEKENAKVLLTQYGGGPDESKIIATKEGYLRFGIEIMKAAYVNKLDEKEKDSVGIEMDYFLSDDSDIGFDWFERKENLEAPVTVQTLKDRAYSAFGMIAVFFIIGIISAGFINGIRWFVSLF